jgi:hypothetical protein
MAGGSNQVASHFSLDFCLMRGGTCFVGAVDSFIQAGGLPGRFPLLMAMHRSTRIASSTAALSAFNWVSACSRRVFSVAFDILRGRGRRSSPFQIYQEVIDRQEGHVGWAARTPDSDGGSKQVRANSLSVRGSTGPFPESLHVPRKNSHQLPFTQHI